jgi:prepilin-type N-terminal cleavage/methylation domain-containing protein
MDKRGFTLLELTISVSVLSIIFMLSFVALQSSVSAMATSSAKARVQDNLRDAIQSIRGELQLAAKSADNSVTPTVAKVAVNANPAAKCPTEIVFQRPRDTTGKLWTTPIRFRFFNEDTNNNGRLDSGEDANNDKVLTRRLLRLQDVNGDGDTADNGESRPVAGANDLSSVTFTINGNVVTVNLTSSQLIPGLRDHPVRMTLSSAIFLQN